MSDMYGTFLTGQRRFLEDPGALGDVLSDFAGRGRGGLEAYDAALQQLEPLQP